MSAHIQPLPLDCNSAFIRTARVICAATDRIYRVRFEDQGQGQEMRAHMAMPVCSSLENGERVLVACQNTVMAYIIGVLDPGPQAIRASQGAGARVQGEGLDQRIVVHDEHEQPIFEYRPASGCSVIKALRGDLQLAAPNGCIDLKAGRGVRLHTEGDVAVTSDQSVRITVAGSPDLSDQELRLDRDGIHMGVHEMDVIAGQGRIRIARAVYHGKQLQSSVDRARMIYGKLEISAQRIWERSGQVLRSVRNLCQIQAGRLRTLVQGAHHVQCERSTLIAKKDVRIDGEKINLG